MFQGPPTDYVFPSSLGLLVRRARNRDGLPLIAVTPTGLLQSFALIVALIRKVRHQKILPNRRTRVYTVRTLSERDSIISQTRMGDWWSRKISLRAMCPKCSAERQVPSKSVLDLFGQEHHWNEGTDNDRIGKRLRCGTCGHRGAQVMVVRE